MAATAMRMGLGAYSSCVSSSMVIGPWVWAKLHKSGIGLGFRRRVPGVEKVNPVKPLVGVLPGPVVDRSSSNDNLAKAVSRKIRVPRGRPRDIFTNIGGSSGLLAKSRLPLNSFRQTNISPAHR